MAGNEFENDYFVEGENDVIYVTARVVTKELVDHIFESYYPDAIYFADSVREFGDRAFKDANLGIVELSSAKNVKKLGSSCFESAFNIDAHDAFESVERLGEACFKNAIILSDLVMPKVTQIPSYAFWNADAYMIKMKNARSLDQTAFKYSCVENGLETKSTEEILKNAALL